MAKFTISKKFTLIVVLLSVLALCLTLAACGGNEKTTTEGAETTTTPVVTTTTTTTTKPASDSTPTNNSTTTSTTSKPTSDTPESTTIPDTTDTMGPVESKIEAMIDDGAEWITPHMEYTLRPRECADGVKRDLVFYFTIKSEGGHFFDTAEDHPTHPKTPGIQLTKPHAIYIKDINKDSDYTEYKITYWETAQWYEIWCVADGFVPEEGAQYDIYLFLMSGKAEDGATYPETLHYIWNLSEPWTYTAPPKPSPSAYLKQEEVQQITNERLWLMQHAPLELDAEGNVHFQCKMDNKPFGEMEGDYGIAHTLFGELYIDGVKYEIVPDSYTTEEWYKLSFKVKDFIPEVGKTYEFLFTINSNDSTGNFCKNPVGYYSIISDAVFNG